MPALVRLGAVRLGAALERELQVRGRPDAREDDQIIQDRRRLRVADHLGAKKKKGVTKCGVQEMRRKGEREEEDRRAKSRGGGEEEAERSKLEEVDARRSRRGTGRAL